MRLARSLVCLFDPRLPINECLMSCCSSSYPSSTVPSIIYPNFPGHSKSSRLYIISSLHVLPLFNLLLTVSSVVYAVNALPRRWSYWSRVLPWSWLRRSISPCDLLATRPLHNQSLSTVDSFHLRDIDFHTICRRTLQPLSALRTLLTSTSHLLPHTTGSVPHRIMT